MSYVELLDKMLFDYHRTLDMMTDEEIVLLKTFVRDVRKIISPGLTRLNWNSLGITDYVQRCNQEINKLVTVLHHIQKNSGAITEVINEISRTNIVKIDSLRKEPTEANVF